MSAIGVCGECRKANRNNNKQDTLLVACKGGCGSVFHPKCINLAEYDISKTIENPYLVILCKLCREKLISLRNIEENIKKIKENFEELGMKFDKVINSENKVSSENKIIHEIKKTIDESLKSEKKSYASEVRKGAILIKPKEPQSSDKTKTDGKLSFNPGDASIQVSGIKKVDKGAIVVSCENGESMEKMKVKWKKVWEITMRWMC